MADLDILSGGQKLDGYGFSVPANLKVRYRDLGDGAWAPVVALAATPTIDIGDVQDAGPAWTSVWGVSGVPITTATTFSTTAATDAPTSGQKLCIDDIIFSTDAATKLTLAEETSGTVMFGPWYVAANTVLQITLRGKKKLATANKKLMATTVGSANATLQVGYHSEA